MNETTFRVAELLAELNPCRPGVDYLVRRLGLTERTVQYHLDMLREAGLLVYVCRGTRVRGERPRASEFLRVIPQAFDEALGIRTVGEGVHRRMAGVADHGRRLLAELGKQVSRRRRPIRRKTAHIAGSRQAQAPRQRANSPAGARRCTPLEGASSTVSTDRSHWFPLEAKLGGGKTSCQRGVRKNAPAKQHRAALNSVGRRHQLARELVAQVPWLARAAVPRVAWVMRELADAGWTCPEVVAWLATREAPVLVRRPVAFLAARISGANEVVTSAEQRQRLVEAWRDDRRAVRDRHAEWDGRWAAPRSRTARTAVAGAFSAPLPEPADVDGAFVHRGGEEVLLDGLIEADVMAARELARQHPELIRMAVETQGLDYALSLYEPGLVHRAMREAAPATPGRRSR